MAKSDLIPLTQRTKDEQKKIRRNGGIASGAARRRKRDLKAMLETMLAGKIDYEGQRVTRYEAIILTLIGKAMEGNTAAIKEIFDRVDGKSIAKVEIEEEERKEPIVYDLSCFTAEELTDMARAAFRGE